VLTHILFKEVFHLDSINAVILAAGEGKRMKSKHPKVSHKVCGKPIIQHVIDSVHLAGLKKVVVVVGHKADEVKKCIGTDVDFVLQSEQLGTGHAVICASEYIKEGIDYTLVLTGDTPLITGETLSSFVEFHKKNKLNATILTSDFEDPTGYGRIVRNSDESVEKIVEHKDASEDEKKIKEINSGMFCFNTKDLIKALNKINNNNAQGEYYLTDVIEIMERDGLSIGAYKIENPTEIMGINDRTQLACAEKVMRHRILNNLMINGVTIMDPDSTYIEKDAFIGADTVVYPNTIIEGNTVIGEDCIIGPNSRIVDSTVHDLVEINNSVVLKSEVKKETHVGPFAYIRPESLIGSNVKIGDFVEIKKSTIGDGTKVSHLTYVGDSEVGRNVNFGCGTVTVNYNGKNKNKTIIGDNAFIGCNTNLVAPVKVGNDAYTAAGSTITREVPDGALAVARERQVNKEGWVERKGLKRK
jgi:bifunctional UDP-N-acetylglucosamine pyrophosphorylase/glucosamine-1-phosphate N-acetyltransferase